MQFELDKYLGMSVKPDTATLTMSTESYLRIKQEFADIRFGRDLALKAVDGFAATILSQKAENDQLTTALAEARAELSKARGEVGRLTLQLDSIPGLWTCPDCWCRAMKGHVCPGCKLNHPLQSKKHPEPSQLQGVINDA